MVIVLAHPWANRLIWEIQQKNNCTIPGLLSLCWKLTLSAWFGGCLQIDVLLDHFYPARCIRLLVWVPTLNGSKLMFSMEKHRTLIWLVVWNMNFIFPYIGNNHPNWLIFFRGVQTTNQFLMGWPCLIRAGNLNGLYQLRLREYKSQCSAENPSTVDEGIDLDTKNPRSFECVHYIIKRMSSVGQSSFQAVLAISSIWIHSHWDFSQKRFSQSETSKLRKLVIHEVKLDHLRMVVDVL